VTRYVQKHVAVCNGLYFIEMHFINQ
jgi:hypothetical protein